LDPLKALVASVCLLAAGLQAQEGSAVVWEPGIRLSWADFRAAPPADKAVAATTASGISYTFTTNGPPGAFTLEYEVTAFFYPGKSWYHPELCNPMVLRHEQLHFDITELYARKMRKLLSGRTFSGNVRAEVRHIFSEINRELSAFQERYDLETDFSRNPEAQLQWNQRVAELLGPPPR
jgi:hypothetical protein